MAPPDLRGFPCARYGRMWYRAKPGDTDTVRTRECLSTARTRPRALRANLYRRIRRALLVRPAALSLPHRQPPPDMTLDRERAGRVARPLERCHAIMSAQAPGRAGTLHHLSGGPRRMPGDSPVKTLPRLNSTARGRRCSFPPRRSRFCIPSALHGRLACARRRGAMGGPTTRAARTRALEQPAARRAARRAYLEFGDY